MRKQILSISSRSLSCLAVCHKGIPHDSSVNAREYVVKKIGPTTKLRDNGEDEITVGLYSSLPAPYRTHCRHYPEINDTPAASQLRVLPHIQSACRRDGIYSTWLICAYATGCFAGDTETAGIHVPGLLENVGAGALRAAANRQRWSF